MTSSIQWAYQRVQHFYSAPLGGTRAMDQNQKTFFFGLNMAELSKKNANCGHTHTVTTPLDKGGSIIYSEGGVPV